MKFTKMHGCGNDYIYVDCIHEQLEDPNGFARTYSDRHKGIGSDGLITINPSQVADFRMRMFNADGSEGSMCGNGIRCVGKFVYDKGLTDKTSISVETLGGIKYLDLTVEEGKVTRVRVDMGHPITRAELIPVSGLGPEVIDQSIHVAGRDWRMTCVSVGNPHAVVWTEDVMALDLKEIGPQFEHHPVFPDRVNTEFAQILDRQNIKMRVWERGSDETMACGSGSTATTYAAWRCGLTDKKVTVHLLGGELEIEYDEERDLMFMTGPAVTVFEGEV
ncbi:MAG: diaminopimelate epimerase [Oscillospiraceae bacterium]|nr:diaminopimelate epimerase [Oscillospiraceae bacterium]